MYKVIGYGGTRAFRLLWMLEELHIPHRHDRVMPFTQAARDAVPGGRLPALELRDRTILQDSTARDAGKDMRSLVKCWNWLAAIIVTSRTRHTATQPKTAAEEKRVDCVCEEDIDGDGMDSEGEGWEC